MKKILQVCAFGAQNPGNFIASLLALEAKMKQEGYETIYAFADTAKGKEWCILLQKKAKVYFLPVARARVLPQTYRVFHKIYRENEIDIVHTHFELYDIPATVMAHARTMVYWHLHDPIVISHGLRGILWKIQYHVIGRKANLISVSDYYLNRVCELGFPCDKACVVLNGISTERIKALSAERLIDYQFMTFGWDYERKGVDIILDACNMLHEEGFRFQLLLNGNDETFSKALAKYDGKQPSFLLFGKSVEDVNELFEKASVFIQASRRETFSYAVCEAAYAGLSVITSDIAGLEWAHHLPTVRFFRSESVEELYRQMKNMINSSGLRLDDVLQTRNYIQTNHSLDAWVEQISKLYKTRGQ